MLNEKDKALLELVALLALQDKDIRDCVTEGVSTLQKLIQLAEQIENNPPREGSES